MKAVLGWIADSMGKHLRRLVDAASASLRGFSSARTSIKFLLGILAISIPLVIFLLQPFSKATPPNIITVNTISDTPAMGFCTLREAIANANAMAEVSGGHCTAGTGTDTINFSVSGSILLGSELPDIIDGVSLTIDGTAQSITIDGGDAVLVVAVDRLATLNLNDITIANGGGFDGGGIDNSGTLNVTSSIFSNNTSFGGGAIFNQGTLMVTGSTFSGNSASNASESGGAIYNETTATIINSTFSSNTSGISGFGGAMYNHGHLTVTGSTFSGNTSNSQGGGIR